MLGRPELLDGEGLQHRVGLMGEPLGELVGGPRVDALQLVEERKLLLLLLGVGGDLLAFALDVGRGDFRLRALGQERARRHRQGRRHGAGQAGGEHEARPPGRAGDAADDAEHRGQAVVRAVDRARDPAAACLVPRLAPENPVEPRLRARYRHRRGLVTLRPLAHLLDRERVGALLLADLAQEPVGLGIAGRALVEVVDLVVLRGFARGEEPVDRRQARLGPEPGREPHARGVGDRDAELAHPRLEPPAVPALGLGHAPEDVGALVVHPLRDQPIDGAGLDLAAPRLEQPVADLRADRALRFHGNQDDTPA